MVINHHEFDVSHSNYQINISIIAKFSVYIFSPGFPPQHEIQTNCLYIYILRIFVDQLLYKIKGISRHSHIHPPSDRVIDLRFIAHFSIPSIQSS